MMQIRGFLKMLLTLFVFCTLNLRRGISGLPLPEQHTFHARASVRSRIGNIAVSRSKRSSDDSINKEPFYATPGIQVYLQRGQTYHMPCPIRREGEKVSVFLWFKGEDLVARHTIVAGDTNFTQSDRFELSGTYGLIVRQVEQGDGGTYTCRVIPYGSSKSRRSSTDVTVLDQHFPVVDDALATSKEQNLTRGKQHELSCPAALPENGTATVYWCLDTGESDFTSIIGVRFSDGEAKVYLEEYNITVDSSLVIKSLKINYSRFWCHLSTSESSLKSGYIDVNGKGTTPSTTPMVLTTHEPGQDRKFGLLATVIIVPILFIWIIKRTRKDRHSDCSEQNQTAVNLEDKDCDKSMSLMLLTKVTTDTAGGSDRTEEESKLLTVDSAANTHNPTQDFDKDCDKSMPLMPLTEATKTDTAGESDRKEEESALLTVDSAANTHIPTRDCGESSSSRTNADVYNIYIQNSSDSITTVNRIIRGLKSPYKALASSQKPAKVTSKKPSYAAPRSAPKPKRYSPPKKSSHHEAGETQSFLQKASTPECAKSELEKVPLVVIVQPKDEIPSKSGGQQQGKLLEDEGNNKDDQDAERIEEQQALQDVETGSPGQTSVIEEETPQQESAPEPAPTEIAETGTKTMEKKDKMIISVEEKGVKTAKTDVRGTTDTPNLSSNPTQDQTIAGKVENDKSERDNNLSPGPQKGKKGKLKVNKKKAKSKKKPKVEPKGKTKSPVKVLLTSDDEKTSEGKTGSRLESQLQPGDNEVKNHETDEHGLTPEKDPEQTSNQQVAVCGSEGIASVVKSSPSSSNHPLPSVTETTDDNLNTVSGEKLSKTIPVAKKKRERKSPCLKLEQNAKPQKSSEPPSFEQMNPTAPANKAIERGSDATMPHVVYPAVSDPDVAPTPPNYHPNPTQPIAAVKPFTCNDPASPHFSTGAAAASVPQTMPYKDDTFAPMSHIGTPEVKPSFTQTASGNYGPSNIPLSTNNWEDPHSTAGNSKVPVPSPNPISSEDESMNSKSDIENEDMETEDSVEHQAVRQDEDEMEAESADKEIDRKVKPKKPLLSQTQRALKEQNPHKQDDRRLKRYPNLKR